MKQVFDDYMGDPVTYLCPECGEDIPCYYVEGRSDYRAICPEDGAFQVVNDADCVGDPPQFVDRTKLHRETV